MGDPGQVNNFWRQPRATTTIQASETALATTDAEDKVARRSES